MSTSTVACGRCGALNEPGFGSCIRCGHALDDAAPAERAKRRVPAPRTDARARLMVHGEKLWGIFRPEDLPVTKALLGLNLLIFAAQVATGLSRGLSTKMAIFAGGRVYEPLLFGALPTWPAIEIAGQVLTPALDEPWRVLSACFVHHGLIHVGMNMMGLVHLGRAAEPLVGSLRFLFLYLLSGIVGFTASLGWALAMGGGAFTAGASGAIFGALGLLLGFAYRVGHPVLKRRLLETVAFALLFGFVVPGIDNSAHIGGLVVGAVGGWLMAPRAGAPSGSFVRGAAHLLAVGAIASLVAARLSPLPGMVLAELPPLPL